jgi:hypothetical protein
MKTFLYMGRNDDNVSGMSYKMWKIERTDRDVTVWYGPAIVKSRRPLPLASLALSLGPSGIRMLRLRMRSEGSGRKKWKDTNEFHVERNPIQGVQ